MTEPESMAYLLEGTRTGKLALVMPSGRAKVTPVRCVIDDDRGGLRGRARARHSLRDH